MGYAGAEPGERGLPEVDRGWGCGTGRHPAVRGVMTWSINWDRHSGDAFSDPVRSHLDNLGSAPPPPPPPPPPGDCTAPAWLASQVYTGGAQVSHTGREWRAKWWTQGEEPGTTGQSGVWEDLGAC